MKKILLIFVCAVFSVKGFAGDGDHYFTLNAGFLFPNTLNATLGYERELEYGNAVELFGEVGNRNKWEFVLLAVGFLLIGKDLAIAFIKHHNHGYIHLPDAG